MQHQQPQQQRGEMPQLYWSLPHEPVDMVVLPSIIFDTQEEFDHIPGLLYKEERHMFTTLFLQNPELRLVYITSYPLDPAVIKYYLSLLPPSSHLSLLDPPRSIARHDATSAQDSDRECDWSVSEMIPGRFYNVVLHDWDKVSLCDKYNKKYDAVTAYIKDHLLRESNTTRYLLCYRTSDLEERLCKELDLQLIGSPSHLDVLGHKSGSRAVFEESRVPFQPGTPLMHTVPDLARAIRDLIETEPRGTLRKLVIKLDDFSAGGGNAMLDLAPILRSSDGSADVVPSVEEIEKHLREKLEPPYKEQSIEEFLDYVPELGAIAERWAEASSKGRLTSPSAQCLITPQGEVCVISTHEQSLSDGKQFAGCCFPAKTKHHNKLYLYTERVGKVLCEKGVRGHFGIDFVELCEDEDGIELEQLKSECSEKCKWQAYGIEINLRFTGTTGPYVVLCSLVPGQYDKNTGIYKAEGGQGKYYDTCENVAIKSKITPSQLVKLTETEKLLQWDSETHTGTLMHALGGVYEGQVVGVTCVGNTNKETQERLKAVEKYFQDESIAQSAPLHMC
eukprot:TRINITY_DN3705_c0_g2_i1.p1 TRINITY_DN3705_c0_g2~~TRINITY_DN3705_c0_g2_i1.p1  ORF type:complete len:562 (+),score=122.07 TRINITY_DN3705_c0_g2_i1:593-2278(+)